ncbi:MAG TPA: SRPBCC domain-containing protein [Acidimicrobiales bacterium]
MTVRDIHNDPEALTMTITAEFDAPIGRVWNLWENPRQLERWWGPPTYPATFVEHDLSPGGRISYFMTGPEGDQPHGWWGVVSVDAPFQLEFENGFADESGVPDVKMPTMMIRVTLSEEPTGNTRMEIVTTFPSVEAMEQIIAMGMQEGLAGAMSQIDEILA